MTNEAIIAGKKRKEGIKTNAIVGMLAFAIGAYCSSAAHSADDKQLNMTPTAAITTQSIPVVSVVPVQPGK